MPGFLWASVPVLPECRALEKFSPFMSVQTPNAAVMLKDSELRSIPASFFHKQLPMLFAEQALYPGLKGKKRKCFLVVYLYGVCLFKIQSMGMGHCKLGEFISIYAIKEIAYTGSKRRELVTRSFTTQFTCDHPDDAVSIIMVARNSIFANARDPSPITLRNFPTSLAIPSVPMQFAAPPSEIRYLCTCFQYSIEPSEQTLDFIRHLNPDHSKVLCLDDTVECPEDVHCLVRPIAGFDRYTTLHVRSFVPYAVCRFVHHVIKKGSGIRNIIFEGYTFLVPLQLRWGNLRIKPTENLCLIFRKCNFPEDVFIELMDELSKFEGEYQRITFDGLDLTPAMCSRLFDAISTAPPFRTLEVIELDGLDIHVLELDNIQRRIFGLMKSHRFLHRLSLSNWRTPIAVPLSLFLSASVLRDVSLCKQDLSQVIGFFALPKSLRILDLSKCHFSQFSLWSFLENLSRHKSGLTVNLNDLFMSEMQWCEFYRGLSAVPRIACLQELDWSGNPLTKDDIPTFLSFFFARNTIKFLVIDRIFRSSTADVLYQLCEGLPKGKLWGLSIGGSPSSNFCGNFHGLIRSVELLDGITTLLLDGQHCSNRDARIVFQYLKNHVKLTEFSCDASSFDLAEFSDFYQKVCGLKQLRCIGRPFRDLDRLKLNDALLEQFRLMLIQKHGTSTPLIRAFFLASHGGDFAKLHRLIESFPRCVASVERMDRFGLKREVKEIGSLFMLAANRPFETLCELHTMFVKDAWSTPTYSELGGIYLEDLRLSISAAAGAAVRLQPIRQAPEIRLVLRDIAGFNSDWKDTGERVDITFPDFGEFGLRSPIQGFSQLQEPEVRSFDELDSFGRRPSMDDAPDLPESEPDFAEQEPNSLPLSDPIPEATPELPPLEILVPIELPPPPEPLALPPPPEALAPMDLQEPPAIMSSGERLVPIDSPGSRDSGLLRGSSPGGPMSFTGLIMTRTKAPAADDQSPLGGRTTKSTSGSVSLLTSTSQTVSPLGQPAAPKPGAPGLSLPKPSGPPLGGARSPGPSLPPPLPQTRPGAAPPLPPISSAPPLPSAPSLPSGPTLPGSAPSGPMLPPPMPAAPSLIPTGPMLPPPMPAAPSVIPTGPTLPPPMPAAPSVLPTGSALPSATPAGRSLIPNGPSLPPPMPPAPSVSIGIPSGSSAPSGSKPVAPALPPPLPVPGARPMIIGGVAMANPLMAPPGSPAVPEPQGAAGRRGEPGAALPDVLGRRERGKTLSVGFPGPVPPGFVGGLFGQDAASSVGKPPGLATGIAGGLAIPRQPAALLTGSSLLRPSPPAGKPLGSPFGGP